MLLCSRLVCDGDGSDERSVYEEIRRCPMEYRTKSGFVLTEEMIEELAEQAERGEAWADEKAHEKEAVRVLLGVAPSASCMSDEELDDVRFQGMIEEYEELT